MTDTPTDIIIKERERQLVPFLDAPQNVHLADEGVTIVVVGSDLVVQVEKEGGRIDRWVIRAYDSDGNHLTDLARSKAGHPEMLGLAVDAAIRLFPNHLTVEADHELLKRGMARRVTGRYVGG